MIVVCTPLPWNLKFHMLYKIQISTGDGLLLKEITSPSSSLYLRVITVQKRYSEKVWSGWREIREIDVEKYHLRFVKKGRLIFPQWNVVSKLQVAYYRTRRCFRYQRGHSLSTYAKFSEKQSFKPLISTRRRGYQGVRNVSFSENFAYVLNGRSQIWSDNLSTKIPEEIIRNKIMNKILLESSNHFGDSHPFSSLWKKRRKSVKNSLETKFNF